MKSFPFFWFSSSQLPPCHYVFIHRVFVAFAIVVSSTKAA